MEPLTSTILVSIVGKPIAKFLFKQAFGDSVVVDVAGELLDTVATIFGEGKETQNVTRQFEAISKGIAENLWPLYKPESDEDYSEAVAFELATTLNQFVNTRLLIDANLDSKQLLNQLKDKRRAEVARLGSAGESLYQRSLQAIAPQLVAFAPHFEDFQLAAQGEQLQRLDNISTQLEFIINGPKIKARLYELRYLSAASQCLDEMELFGAELAPGQKRHPLLSVAFVSLNLKQQETNTNIDVQRLFDEQVKGGSRLLIIGEAGSGKSTLMRWIALKAARYLLELEKPVTQRFLDKEDSLLHQEQDEDWWHKRVPFLVRLREYPDGQLPEPNAFAPALEAALGEPPDGWVQSVLDEGRGLVIFDGIDEVPTANRDALQRGMEGYFRNYPSTAFLLAGRPAATEDWQMWRQQWEVTEARINPMSNPEKESLVRRWHDAVRKEMERQKVKKEDIAAVSEKEKALIEKLFNDPNLSRLASYPLLCAVICALHHWKGAEPLKGYWRLCDELCRLLINDRDIEARIRLEKFPAPYAALDYEEKREIAQTIALAMAEPSFQSSLPLETAVNLTKPILTDIPGRKAGEASTVVRFMGERSGLLRVPREGDVEFIHNIFKEFLIADAFLKQGRLNDLLDKAADADWAGVIVCAAASPHRGVATAIVRRLLEIGTWHAELLALRCYSLKRYFDDALEPQVQLLTERLFPPQDREQAEAIATLGNAATERLKYRDDLADNQVVASVQALGFIDTSHARTAAETYINDRGVFNELVRVINPLLIPQVIEQLQKEDSNAGQIEWRRQIVELELLASYQELTTLNLCETSVSDVSPLTQLTNLQSLDLMNTQVSDMSPLAQLTNLHSLNLKNTQVSDVSPLAQLTNLQRLFLMDTQVSDVSPLGQLTNLQLLNLRDTQVSDVSPLAQLTNLQRLGLSNTQVSNVSPLAQLTNLQILFLMNTQVSDVLPLTQMTNLQRLGLSKNMRDKMRGVELLRVKIEWI